MSNSARNVRDGRVAAILLLALFSSILRAESRPEFEVHIDSEVMAPMRDGVRLAADIYRPAQDDKPAEDRFPVILTRTPYNKEGNKSLGEYFAARGYVF